MWICHVISMKEKYQSLYSSVVEHWSRKPGVVSSILTGGIVLVYFSKILCVTDATTHI